MKKCDCEHWETCMICYPQGFDAQGKRKPVEVPPSREELQAKVAGLTQERDKFESALYGADEMAAACDYLVKNNLIDARSALADARLIYGTPYKYKSRITRAEAVIEKASEALEWAKCYCSKAIHKVQVQPAALEALAAITEYREGK
jgi:hypothetical protein